MTGQSGASATNLDGRNARNLVACQLSDFDKQKTEAHITQQKIREQWAYCGKDDRSPGIVGRLKRRT